MTCRECRDLLLEVARRRAAPLVEQAVATHAAGCVDCARRLERERSLTAGLRALAAADAALPSAELERRMAAAFAALHRNGAVPAAPDRGRGWLPLAASLILAAGLTAWWAIDPAPVAPQPTDQQTAAATRPAAPAHQSQGSAPSPTDADGAIRQSSPRPHTSVPTTAAAARPRAAAVRPAPDPQPVQPTGFTLIPSAAGLPDFESGEIVRLEMTMTSLPNYGVEMPSDASSASVQADLLLGQDGQPRAIRLVTGTAEDSPPRR